MNKMRRRKNGNIAKLHGCLTDKSHMEYQRLPVFPEIVTMLHKFGKLFKLTPISFPELEQALDYEAENYGVDRDCWVRSKVLLKLYRELLSFFGCSAECDRAEINTAIWALLSKWSRGGVLSIDDKILRASDVCELFPEKKLDLIRIFLNAIFYADRAQRILEDCNEDDLRVMPLFLDQQGNKFWYFCDTYLYMEEPEPTAEKSPSKMQRRLNAARREATQNLFTAEKLRLVCRTSEDWNQLLKMYENNGDSKAIAKLTDLIASVKSIENKRLKEQIASVLPPRSSSRIQNKLEEKKRQEELQRMRAEEEKRRRDQVIKKLLEEQQATESHKRAIDLVLGMNKFPDLSQSREERRLQREHKKLEQQHASMVAAYSEKRVKESDEEVKPEASGENFNDANVVVKLENGSAVSQGKNSKTVEIKQSPSADTEQKTEAVQPSDQKKIQENCAMVLQPSPTAASAFVTADVGNGGVGGETNRAILRPPVASVVEESDDIIDIERVDDESVILPEVADDRVSDAIGDYVVVSTANGREVTPELYYYEEDDTYRLSRKRKSHPPPKRRCYKKDAVLPINLDEMDLDAPGAIGIDHLNGGMLLSRSGSRTRGDSSSSKLSNRMESNYSLYSTCHMSPSSFTSAERRNCSRDGASNEDGNNNSVIVVDDEHHPLPSQSLNQKLSGGGDYRRSGPASHYFVKYQDNDDGGGGPSSSSSVSSAHQPPVLERQESVNVKPVLTSLVKRRRSGDGGGGNTMMMGMNSRNVLNNGYSVVTGFQKPPGTYRGSAARGRGGPRGRIVQGGRGRGAGPPSTTARDTNYYGFPKILPQLQRVKYFPLSADPMSAYEHPKYYIGDRTTHEHTHKSADSSLQCENSTNGATESLEMFVVDRNELTDCVEEVVVQASTSDFQTPKKNTYSREPPKFTASDNAWRTDFVEQVVVEHDYSLSPIFNPAHYEEVATSTSSPVDAKIQRPMDSWSGGRGGSIITNLPYQYYN